MVWTKNPDTPDNSMALSINPIDALFWASVINGFLACPLLVILMLVANNKKVMGNYVNGQITNVLGWTTTLLMLAAAALMVVSWIIGAVTKS